MIQFHALTAGDREQLAESPFADCSAVQIPENWRELLATNWSPCFICGATTWCSHREPELVAIEVDRRCRIKSLVA